MSSIKNLIPAFLVALGLAAIGLGVNKGFEKIADRDRQVTVKGLAEREVKADKVTWPLVFNLFGNDLPTLYTQINQTNSTVVKFLTDNGVSQDEISINAPDITDNQTYTYSSSNAPRFRYSISSVIVVTSSDVDKINGLIKRQSELLKDGIALSTEDYSHPTQYEFTGLNEIKPAMIAEATKNAREAADKFAEDSGSEIGKIISASQGQFSIEDRDQYTPYIKDVRVVTSIRFEIDD